MSDFDGEAAPEIVEVVEEVVAEVEAPKGKM